MRIVSKGKLSAVLFISIFLLAGCTQHNEPDDISSDSRTCVIEATENMKQPEDEGKDNSEAENRGEGKDKREIENKKVGGDAKEEKDTKEQIHIKEEADVKVKEGERKIVNVDYSEFFQDIKGCAVVYDAAANEYMVYNEEMAKERVSPYSTFKIISTLMGLKKGILIDKESKMDYADTIYPNDVWNQNLSLVEAFQTSCIWYFRQVIDAVGVKEVQEELADLAYGNCDATEWSGSGINPGEDLNGFWLGSSLLISPMEQVQVMQKIFGGDSIYSDEEIAVLKEIMLSDTVNGYTIYGKTGTNRNIEGWYVGFAKREQEEMYFAIYITGEEKVRAATGGEAREIVKKILEAK